MTPEETVESIRALLGNADDVVAAVESLVLGVFEREDTIDEKDAAIARLTAELAAAKRRHDDCNEDFKRLKELADSMAKERDAAIRERDALRVDGKNRYSHTAEILGTRDGESVPEAARRVVSERDTHERTLQDIAMLAHSGGLAGLGEHAVDVAIRRLSLAHWDDSGTLEDAKERVLRAIQGGAK